MTRSHTRATSTDTLFPYTTLFRSADAGGPARGAHSAAHLCRRHPRRRAAVPTLHRRRVSPAGAGALRAVGACRAAAVGRSEEHTSELQSLMRISYAVFCLKKKTISTANMRPTRTQTHT